MQFIVSKKEFIPPVIAPDIIETLGDDYEIWTYEDYERLPPLLVEFIRIRLFQSVLLLYPRRDL